MRKVRSGIHYLLVFILITLGLIGLALPLVPQLIFFALAFIILSFEIPALANYVESKMDKNSKIWNIYHTHRKKFEKYFE